MSHKNAADYHRSQANIEVARQGSGLSESQFVDSRFTQKAHTEAARSADSAYAREIGKEVIYTPVGDPVFR